MKNKKLTEYKFDIQGYKAIKPDLIDTFPYEHKGKNITVTIDTDEFSAVCPWSGLPDYGTIIVEYIPKAKVLELKSFKYYLYTYRNVGVYQEHAVNMIFDHVQKAVSPKWMKITLTYNIRGGMGTTVERETKTK
ncbi:preQ(1) synthase [Spirochaetota bacterium]